EHGLVRRSDVAYGAELPDRRALCIPECGSSIDTCLYVVDQVIACFRNQVTFLAAWAAERAFELGEVAVDDCHAIHRRSPRVLEQEHSGRVRAISGGSPTAPLSSGRRSALVTALPVVASVFESSRAACV